MAVKSGFEDGKNPTFCFYRRLDLRKFNNVEVECLSSISGVIHSVKP
jgi:hypothetical protein